MLYKTNYRGGERISKKNCAIPLLLIFMLAALTNFYVFTCAGQVVEKESRDAVNLINSNMNLKLWENRSTQIGIGTVQSTYCKFEDAHALYTYAEISVTAPVTDNLELQQTVLVKYLGGEIGDEWCVVFQDWPYFESDTVIPPEVFDLKKGMDLLFFANDTNGMLLGYVLYSTVESVQGPSRMLASEPQPTTHVDEDDGFGFEWLGLHLDWNDMPREYNIDPNGTGDIQGTTDEFNAIHEAHSTWENAPYCGFDFVFGDYSHDYTCYADAVGSDGVNNVHWELDFPDSNVAANILKGSPHMVENDIVFNDEDYQWLIGSGFWPWEYDLQAVATHEIGHTLGLNNLENESNSIQTMKCGSHDTSRRTLEWGDLNGAHYLYPEHDDAGSGADAGDSVNEATYVDRNVWYTGRLCYLPDDEDGSDYFKFYAPSTMRVEITMIPASYADFDLELRDPNGNLVDYSRHFINGYHEVISRNPIGSPSGYWTIRIYNHTNTAQRSNGQYEFYIDDYGAKYVSDAYGEVLSGYGGSGYWEPASAEGSSPDGNFAGVYGYNVGDAACIIGTMNDQVPSGGSHIYIYGYTMNGYNARIYVYVSQNNNNDWYYVSDLSFDYSSPETIQLGYTTRQFRYVGISIYIEEEYEGSALLFDCVIVTP